MDHFDLPIRRSPLRTRADMERALLQILEPVRGHFTPGNAGLHLGDFAAHYGESSAHMEAFSRMLWGLAPLWSQGGGGGYLPLFRQGLVNGTDPEHPAYWGKVADCDQKIVEMAAIALTLMLCGPSLELSPREAQNLHRWLAGVEGRVLPQNNWLFFRVLVQAAFRRMGWPWDREQLEADLERLEDWYLGDGWYCDGQPSQVDYYIPFGMHYYGLIYARFMEGEDPARAQRFRERAARFAQDYLYWFEDGGRSVPFGRSLTYRFAQSAFFSALAFAGVEALPWGVMKSRVLGNLRDWFSLPIFSPDGLLTVGYGYPNLCVGENYNAPGSPYWALKAFLCLALPEEHPFWRAQEQVPPLEPLRALPRARMLIARSGEQVQLYPAGQRCVCQLGQVGPKYEKLVYSSRFAFSVSRGNSLEEGAFDNCLAVSEAGEDCWRAQRGFDAYEIGPDYTWRRFSPMRGVWVEVKVIPRFPSHRREYRIVTDRPIDAVDSGFALPAEQAGQRYQEDMTVWEAHGVAARCPWGISAIRCEEGGGQPLLVTPWPNTNLLSPLTRIPAIRWRLEPGEHRLATWVTGDIPNG
ncbi:MAG: DUF2264 domain-containing protein [Oscillospiraceae bacterium]|nr:DUF2264 domain-containing protein [Oscillospiraceae bacterium]